MSVILNENRKTNTKLYIVCIKLNVKLFGSVIRFIEIMRFENIFN